MPVLLISTYDLGRQPFGLASGVAALEAAGVRASCVDLSRERLRDDDVRAASVIGFFLPMHTATRLALPVIDRVRALNPAAVLVAFGLYAPLNARLLRDRGVGEIIGGEFEDALAAAAVKGCATEVEAGLKACATKSGAATDVAQAFRPAGVGCATTHVAHGFSPARVDRVRFLLPQRASLPALDRYASLQWGSERRIAGYTEASRGCKHLCRHCPIVPVYNGTFRVVPPDVVLGDIRQQVAAGARHISFGDPDFFNGPRHAAEVVRRLAAHCPGISYDVTIKVEHLIRHRDLLPLLRDTGCAFVTSAVESIDDAVLARLDKGHTAADFETAVSLCRAAGLVLSPTFVAFTPWTTTEGYRALLQTIDRLDLVDQVAPIQLAIRLLIPEGSRLLELEDVRAMATAFDDRSLTYRWRHQDPAVDQLQETIAALVGRRLNAPRRELFDEIWAVAHGAATQSVARVPHPGLLPRAAVPYLNEPWYC